MNPKLILYAILIVWGGLLSGQIIAQDLTQKSTAKFNQAVLDSAILYEFLKPVALNLQLENKQLIKENLALRLTVKLTAVLTDQEKRKSDEKLATLKKKLKRTRRIAIGLGILATFLAADQ